MLYYLWNSRPILLPKIIHPYLTRQPGANLVHKSITSQDFSIGQPGARAVQNSLQVFFFSCYVQNLPCAPSQIRVFNVYKLPEATKSLTSWELFYEYSALYLGWNIFSQYALFKSLAQGSTEYSFCKTETKCFNLRDL